MNTQPEKEDQLAVPKTKRSWLPRGHAVSWWMLLITTLAILLTSIDRIILPTVQPAIMREFNLNEVQIGWLNSLSFIGTFIGAIVFGLIADMVGKGYKRGWAWVAAIGVTAIAGVATMFNKTVGSLQIWRVIMGIGTGGSEPVNVAIIGEWWQKENRGFAVGVHHTGFPFGQFLGPVLIGAILALGTWRHAFLWIPAIAIPIMILQMVVGSKKNQERVFSWIRKNGMTVPFEEDEEREKPRNPFVIIREVMSNRNVVLSITIIFLFLWAEIGVATFLTEHLIRLGIPLATAAIISGASGLTGWLGQAVWGTISDHIGRRICLVVLCVGWIAAVISCIFIDSATTAWIILIAWGLFRNAPYPVVYALLMDSVPKTAASGMGLMIGIANGLAGFLVAPVAGFFIMTWGFTSNYLMLTAACVLALIPIAMLREAKA